MEEGMSRFYVKAGRAGGGVEDGGNGGCGYNIGKGSSGSKCGRWNPTGEQVKVLTELFRSGLRTPSSDQIQKISHQLSFYGKIESKNVFYWFQNHKARERQKRRKVSLDDSDHHHHHHHFLHHYHESSRVINPTPKHVGETNIGMMESERVKKTLQLFPINSIEETETDQFRVNGKNEYEETRAFTYKIETKMDHPPLDLRLSFL